MLNFTGSLEYNRGHHRRVVLRKDQKNMIKLLKMMVFGLFFVTQSIVAAYADDAKQGQENYRRFCISCHGVTGVGDGPVADSLKKKPSDLTLLTKRSKGVFPSQRVIKTIDGRLMPEAHGSAEMPVWGTWFAILALVDGVPQEDVPGIEREVNQRLEGLVLYLKTLQK